VHYSEKKSYSFLEILSGQAEIASTKKANPALFKTSKPKPVTKKVKINANAQKAIERYRVRHNIALFKKKLSQRK
jgi:hypothetical protein